MSQVCAFLRRPAFLTGFMALCLMMPSTEALADLSANLAMGYNLDDNSFLSSTMAGFLNGDPAAGKLVPYYKTGGGQATVIGIENVLSAEQGVVGTFIIVHVFIFDVRSTMFHEAALCLSPYDYGFIVLQQNLPTAAQTAESGFGLKVLIASVTGDTIPTEGYVTLRATGTASDCLGTNLVQKQSTSLGIRFTSSPASGRGRR